MSSNYCFPQTWPNDRERRARITGEWLKTEARYLSLMVTWSVGASRGLRD